MPTEKIVLGLAAFGHSWTLANDSSPLMNNQADSAGHAYNARFYSIRCLDHDKYCAILCNEKFTKQPGLLAYYEVCDCLNNGWTRAWDNEQKVPYMYMGTQWASYDDKQSLNEKVYSPFLYFLQPLNIFFENVE